MLQVFRAFLPPATASFAFADAAAAELEPLLLDERGAVARMANDLAAEEVLCAFTLQMRWARLIFVPIVVLTHKYVRVVRIVFTFFSFFHLHPET